MAKDYSDWLSKQQAAEAIGVSTKTVETMAKGGLLHHATQKRPGLPPRQVYHPEDVDRERRARNPEAEPFIVPTEHTGPPLAVAKTQPQGVVKAGAGAADALQAILGAVRVGVGPQDKLYLTLEEAVQLSGLPRAFLEGLITDGKLTPLIVGKHGKGFKRRLRRTDLESLSFE